MNKFTIHMLTNWPLTSYLCCLSLTVPSIPLRQFQVRQKRGIALTLGSVFNHFLSCIHYLKKDYKTEKNKEDIFTVLPALSISSIFRLIHFFYEHQKICRIFKKKVLKRLFFRTAALALRK